MKKINKIFSLVIFPIVVSMTVIADTIFDGFAHISLAKANRSNLVLESQDLRIGLIGINRFDSGLKATYQFQVGYNIFEDDGSLILRKAWVGIQGSYGEIRVGKQTTAFSALSDSIDLLQRNGHKLHTTLELPNIIAYLNKFGSLGLSTSYVTSDDIDTNGIVNLLVNYKTRPLYAGLVYQKMPSGTGDDGVKLALAYNVANFDVSFVAEKKPSSGDKINTLSARYNFGKASVVAQYGKNQDTDVEQKNIEFGYKLGKDTMTYFEWEDIGRVKSNRVGLVHKF